uniref:Uncharacterized protein n=1 Tax=Anopheles maculatus TaxID=74869 RepID=A0A182T4T6_9DIPT
MFPNGFLRFFYPTFSLSQESFIVQDAKSNDLQQMVEKALHHGKKPPRAGKSLGWIGFPVGCGEKMSASAKETVRNLNAQLSELRDITGMDFGWWIIWKVQADGKAAAAAAGDKSATRMKREVDPDDDYYDYEDDDDATDDDEG